VGSGLLHDARDRAAETQAAKGRRERARLAHPFSWPLPRRHDRSRPSGLLREPVAVGGRCACAADQSRSGTRMRSHFGRLRFNDLQVDVEVMGAVQKRTVHGPWTEPTDPSDHRVSVSAGSIEVPVLSLRYGGLTRRTELDALIVHGSFVTSQHLGLGLGHGTAHPRRDPARRPRPAGRPGSTGRRSGDRVMPITSWPAAASCWTSWLPIAPVAPATNTFMGPPSRYTFGPTPLQTRQPCCLWTHSLSPLDAPIPSTRALTTSAAG
jgi:hypothetical protein